MSYLRNYLQFVTVCVLTAPLANAVRADDGPRRAVYSPDELPGTGLAQHPFLYAGEWDTRKDRLQTIFVVRDGKVAWSYGFPIRDTSGTIHELGDAAMRSNGNTVICNWCAGGAKAEDWPNTVQILEVTPAKKVVWALRSWTGGSDLGPSSSIQLLDEPGVAEEGDLQR